MPKIRTRTTLWQDAPEKGTVTELSIDGFIDAANYQAFEKALESVREPITVAIMGCMVNGPGEARGADVALAGGKGKFALYVAGRHRRTVPEDQAVAALLEAVAAWRPE